MLMKLRTMMRRDEKGFTLVELIVVMAILAVLAALAVPRFGTVLDDSKHKAHNDNIVMIYKAGQMYLAAQGNPTEGIVADAGIQTLVNAGYLDNATIKVPYDGSKSYTCSISTAGVITVAPGAAKKGADGKWQSDESYTGGPIGE